MKRLLLLLFVGPFSGSAQKPPTTTATELKAFYDIASLPAYRDSTISGQTSTYDTTGGNNDGFNGNYSFVKRNADSSLTIFDLEGPGVINRIWTPTPTRDTLDFYVDDTIRPVLSICYMDLFSGKVAPFAAPLCGNQLGGYYCYYPILFRQHCRIVCRGKSMQFHQVQYRLYARGTDVRPFTGQPDTQAQTTLHQIKTLWDMAGTGSGPESRSEQRVNTSFQLHPGETRVIAQIGVGGRISAITLSPANVLEGLKKDVDLRVYWDDDKVPAIDCPAADFFGFAFGARSMQSLLLGVAGNRAYCYFPMPFDKKARVELVYRQRRDAADEQAVLPITTEISYTPQPRDPRKEGKLYAYWQQENTETGKPHLFLDVKGKGHYVATLLQAQGLRTGMTIFFEGDDSTVIDGKLRLHGTGSEDYFNGGWYALQDRWDTKMSLPLHGALDYSLVFSRTGGYRLYLGDKLSFANSFYHTIEHGPEHNSIPAIYTSVAFYYGSQAPAQAKPPGDADTRVYMPDTLTIYPQFTKFIAGSNMVIKTLDEDATIGQAFDLTVNEESFLKLSLEEVPPGRYQVYTDQVNLPDGCRYSLWQRQTQVSEWIDTKTVGKNRPEKRLLGEVVVTELNKTVTMRFLTKEGHHYVFSRLMLVRL